MNYFCRDSRLLHFHHWQALQLHHYYPVLQKFVRSTPRPLRLMFKTPLTQKSNLGFKNAVTSDPILLCKETTGSAFISDTPSLRSIPAWAHCKTVIVFTGNVSVTWISTVPAIVSEEKPNKRRHSSVRLPRCNLDSFSKQRKLTKVRGKLTTNSLNFHGRPILETRICSNQVWTGIFKNVKKTIPAKWTELHWSNIFHSKTRKKKNLRQTHSFYVHMYSAVVAVPQKINFSFPAILAIQTRQNLQARTDDILHCRQFLQKNLNKFEQRFTNRND